MRQNEVPMPLSDVRLVVPYEIVLDGEKTYSDVVVDKVRMVRHTTGIDPFTGADYGDAEIPKDHQYDPANGLPIFHRYIAGTQHRIEWPWQKEEDIEDSGHTEQGRTDNRTWWRKLGGRVRYPTVSWKNRESGDKKGSKDSNLSNEDEEPLSLKIEEAKTKEQERLKEKPRSKDPDLAAAYDNTDTTRNIVEGAESMAYTLIAPPFPDTLRQEIRGNIQEFAIESSKNKDADAPRAVKPKRTTEQGIKAREVAKARHAAAQKMKTPMQLRWEQEHTKKVQSQKKAPLVTTEALMVALGQHLQKAKVAKRSLGVTKVEELD
jgi:large subunit ribosomal protein L24